MLFRRNKNSFAGIVVDMQDYYLKHHFEERKEVIIPSQLNVLRFCAEQDYPVVVLEMVNRGFTISELQEGLMKVPRRKYLLKGGNSGFVNPNLLKKLEEWNVNHLILMGINAKCCVKDTAISAMKYGLEVSSAEDLINNVTYWDNGTSKKEFRWFYRNCKYFEKEHSKLLESLGELVEV